MKKELKMTTEEAREKLILHFWQILEYWEQESRKPSTREKMEGLLFSILVTLDGGSGMMPGFTVSARVPPADVKFHEKEGSKYFPPDEDLAGGLHDLLYSVGRKHGKVD
jgi:hypothetical protein